MSAHAHHDWADSMADYGHAHAEELKARSTCLADELAHHFVDALPEPYSQGDDQSESADREVGGFIVKAVAVLVLVLFCAWVIAGGADPYIARIVEATNAP